MKVLKALGVVLGSLIVLFFLITAFMSPKSHMERAIVVNAAPEAIFQVVNNYQNFNKWSPWADIDPNTKYFFEGPQSGVGAKMRWESKHDQVGNGSQWILESEENKRIKSQMKFGDMSGTYTSQILITPVEGGTEIVWTYDGDVTGTGLSSSMYKVMGKMMDKFLGPMYEKGLSKLRDVVETNPTQKPMAADSTTIK
jgi:uncharacterized cupredoxin-like copper-binding protein